MGVFIVQQGNAVENKPKQGAKGKHSGTKDKRFDKTLKKAMELGMGDKGLAKRGSPSRAPNFWCNEEEEGS